MIKLWQRYFLKETLKTFFLVLGGFYFLFILVDYASHSNGTHYPHSGLNWILLVQHYLSELSQRLDVFVPFALFIATARTLFKLNEQNELVALLASGIAMKRLLIPFVFLGVLATSILYVNSEFFLPKFLNQIRQTEAEHLLFKNRKNNKIFVQNLKFKDGSTLLYQDFDRANYRFFDLYWIRSFDQIWRIKHLEISDNQPIGYQVEKLERDQTGKLHLVDRFDSKAFKEMKFSKKMLINTATPVQDMAISSLWKKMRNNSEKSSEKQVEIATTFYLKLALPWLALFAVLGPAPFCVRFSRQQKPFFIYSFGLFGITALYLMLDAAHVLGSRQVIDPHLAIGIPFILTSVIIIIGFFKR